MVTMLEFRDVSKSFAQHHGPPVRALSDVSFELREAEWAILIGENGSGKSTIFRLCTGEQTPDSGEILVMEREITRLALHKRAQFMTYIRQSRRVRFRSP